MVKFKNPFFSWKGQKERLKNVVDVLKIAVNPFTKDKLKVDKRIPKVIARPLKKAAENPFVTAGIVATGLSAAGRNVVKKAAVSVGKSFARSSIKTKAAVIGGGIVGAGILKESRKARKVVSRVPEIPGSLASFGADVGKFIQDPSGKTLKNILVENPMISSVVGIGGAIAVAPVVAPVVAAAVAGSQRKQIVEALQKAPVVPSTQVIPSTPTGISAIVPDQASPMAEIETVGSVKKIPKTTTPRRSRSPLVVNQIQITN